MPDNYYLSDSAYFGLIHLAAEQGFTRVDMRSHRGLSLFLDKLSFSEFIDSRPHEIRKWHQKLLSEQRRPQWTDNLGIRISRYLSISDETIYNYVEIGLHLRVHIPHRLVRGGRANRSALAICGNVLEAIGVGWIVPVTVPVYIADAQISRNVDKSTRSKKPSRTLDHLHGDNPYDIYLRRRSRREDA